MVGGEWDRGHDSHSADFNHRGGAVDTERFTEIEDEETTPPCVVRQAIRMAADGNAAQQLLVRGTEDTDPVAVSVRREEEILLAVDEDAGNPRQIRQGAHVPVRLTVEDVDPVGAGARDVDALTGTCTVVDVRMIEPRAIARRDRDEALLGQCHPHAPSPEYASVSLAAAQCGRVVT